MGNRIESGFGEIFRLPRWNKVEYHSYRTARCACTMFELERTSETGREIEELLMARAKKNSDNPDTIFADNHTCYSISPNSDTPDAEKMVVFLSDGRIRIGVGLVRERW
jgi:hypothetical protein